MAQGKYTDAKLGTLGWQKTPWVTEAQEDLPVLKANSKRTEEEPRKEGCSLLGEAVQAVPKFVCLGPPPQEGSFLTENAS